MQKIGKATWRVTTQELETIRRNGEIDGIKITKTNKLIAAQVSAGIWEVWFQLVW